MVFFIFIQFLKENYVSKDVAFCGVGSGFALLADVSHKKDARLIWVNTFFVAIQYIIKNILCTNWEAHFSI